MTCGSCGGVYHPATGDHDVRYDFRRCGRCYRIFLRWYRQHTKRKWGGHNFYAVAQTSIREGVFPTHQAARWRLGLGMKYAKIWGVRLFYLLGGAAWGFATPDVVQYVVGAVLP